MDKVERIRKEILEPGFPDNWEYFDGDKYQEDMKYLLFVIDQRDRRIKELEKQLKLFKQTFGIKQDTIIRGNK